MHLLFGIPNYQKTPMPQVQRIAARWVDIYYELLFYVKSNYNWETSVSSMLSELQWPMLHAQRLMSRLTIFYKGVHNSITLLT